MIGAIAGDIIGSIYEMHRIKTKDFPLFQERSRFTDDTVLTVAVADCILHQKEYKKTLFEYGNQYPKKGYGGMFKEWLLGMIEAPFNSFGNGSAMRVSPVGFAFDTEADVLRESENSAAVTHNHPEGIKGAQAIAMAVFLARKGNTKDQIRTYIQAKFGYNLNRSVDQIRVTYHFDVTCQGSVPEAIISFLESISYEDAIRNAISLGGDSDTLACMAGAIAEAFYKEIPEYITKETRSRLTPDLLKIVDEFEKKYGINIKIF